jgi:hypothetical protein
MAHYFIDNHAQPNGDHEVHKVGCVRMPMDKRYLGNYEFVSQAMLEARKEFWQSNGCVACARDQHKAGYSPIEVARSGAYQRLRLR